MFECDEFECDVNNSIIAQHAIIMGVCDFGDGLLYFKNNQNGESLMETLAQKCGINMYEIPVYEKNHEINMKELERLLNTNKEIKMIMLDGTMELREESLILLRNIVPENILITYDCSYNAGLIFSGLLPQPIMMGIDILYGCTNITIPGPQNGFICYKNGNNQFYDSISYWCKILNPDYTKNEHIISLILSFHEMKLFGREYCKQMIENTKSFVNSLTKEGFSVYGNSLSGMNTNQLYIVIGSLENAKYYRNNKLLLAGIYVDIVKIPGENDVYGFNIGTQTMTRRGFKGKEFEEIARIFARLILKDESPQNIKFELKSFNDEFPVFPLKFSFDNYIEEDPVKEFICEVLR